MDLSKYGKFQPGRIINTHFGAPIKIVRFLTMGGRGEIYLVEYGGKKKALKWITTCGNGSEGYYQLLKQKIERGSPGNAFLWPRTITEKIDGQFGYIMDIKCDGYYEYSEFLMGNIKFESFEVIMDACRNIVSAFKQLHEHGYCFESVVADNFLINPKTGEVLICDIDDIVPQGISTGTFGIPRYMAPEVVFKRILPSVQTDNYSLSVILFMVLCMNHPLEGQKSRVPCMTPTFVEKLYYSEALFVFDKNDQSNALSEKFQRDALERWDLMPEYIKDAFHYAFSQQTIIEPDKRMCEDDWLELLNRFKTELTPARQTEEPMTPCKGVLPIFYLFDTSGSMTGPRITAVNEAMRNTMWVLKDIISECEKDRAEIQFAVMQFSDSCSWVTHGLVGMKDFFWDDLHAGGLTAFGAACVKLHDMLSSLRRDFRSKQTPIYRPIILLLTDGQPTDIWEKPLDLLKQNKLFGDAIKIAIAIGVAPDKKILGKFTDNDETVISVEDAEVLRELIREVSVTSIARSLYPPD